VQSDGSSCHERESNEQVPKAIEDERGKHNDTETTREIGAGTETKTAKRAAGAAGAGTGTERKTAKRGTGATGTGTGAKTKTATTRAIATGAGTGTETEIATTRAVATGAETEVAETRTAAIGAGTEAKTASAGTTAEEKVKAVAVPNPISQGAVMYRLATAAKVVSRFPKL
jgi:DNA end-binding protein Ku